MSQRKKQRPAEAPNFWDANPEALFTRLEVADVRRCSVALLEREACAGKGIPFIKDGVRALYRKKDVLKHLGIE